jgi:hypothetical protein
MGVLGEHCARRRDAKMIQYSIRLGAKIVRVSEIVRRPGTVLLARYCPQSAEVEELRWCDEALTIQEQARTLLGATVLG